MPTEDPETTSPRPGGEFTLSGRPVARLGYGTMQLSGPGGRPRPAESDAHTVLRRAVDLGVNHLDTALFYGDGLADRLIHDALAPYPDDLVIVSKVGAAEAGGSLVAAQRPSELRAAVERELGVLGVERIDVVNLRRLDGPPGIVAEGEQVVDLDSQLAELVALRDEGAIGGIGLSQVSGDQLRAALPAGIACVQNGYNLLDRAQEPMLELCRANGIAWAPFFPLGSAFAGRRRVTDEPVVRAVAERVGASPAQVGLAWLLAHAENVLLIPGTTSLAHLEENVAAGAIELAEDDRRALDAVAPA